MSAPVLEMAPWKKAVREKRVVVTRFGGSDGGLRLRWPKVKL